MRILVVQESDWLKRNPVQQHHMLERLSAQGHEVLVLDYPIRWRDEGAGLIAPRRVHRGVAKVVSDANVTVIRTASLRVPGLGKLVWLATNTLELRRAFRTFRPDVVVTLGLSNSLVALGMARKAGVPVVVHLIDALHTLVEPEVLRPIAAAVERAILRCADRVVVINKALGAYAERMGVRREAIDVIPTGADTVRFGPHVDGSVIRHRYGIAPDECVMLFVGWLYPFCGLKEVAQAMADDPTVPSSLKLMVVGDGDQMPDLRRLRDERLGERLILTGAQPAASMPGYLAAADICLLPAHANRTMEHIVPAKVYEYLAAGKPIIASPLPGLQDEFAGSGAIGYARGPVELVRRAAELAPNAAQRAALGAAARRRAVKGGDWEAVGRRFLSVLASVRTSQRIAAQVGWYES